MRSLAKSHLTWLLMIGALASITAATAQPEPTDPTERAVIEKVAPSELETAPGPSGDTATGTQCPDRCCRRSSNPEALSSGKEGRCPRCGASLKTASDDSPRIDCGRRRGQSKRKSFENGGRHRAGGGHGPGPASGRLERGRHRGNREEMAAYRTLLENHETIERTVEEIPGGVRTVTRTNAELLPTLLLHVAQMKELIESGGRIRAWDPLFAEIFEHADKIEMTIEPIEGGVSVTETSDDKDVATLIRAHAVKVNQFVARGQEAYGEPTPLPTGYQDSR